MTTTTLVPIITLSTLSDEINHAHQSVTHHARSMLLDAKRAGEALRAAKKMVKHGEFKAWVERYCQCSYPTARRYMQVAKMITHEHFDPSQSVRAFLEAHAERKVEAPEAVQAVFDKAGADYAMKLHRMTESPNVHEAANASSKLERLAKDFGMTATEAVHRAMVMLPDDGKSADQIETEAKLKVAETRLAEVEAKVQYLMRRKAELAQEFSRHTREELVEMLISMKLQMEQSAA